MSSVSDADALIRVVQSALKATERHAHQILDLASRMLAITCHDDLTGSAHARSGFLRTWSDLCGSLRDYWINYAGRTFDGTFIPRQFRPHEFLSCVATTSEIEGVVGHSLCHIAYKYGWKVRQRVRQVVPREIARPATSTTDPQSLLVVQLAEPPRDTQGGFGFPITDESIPAVRTALREFEAWAATTVERVKIGVTQEVGRGWLQVPVTIRALWARVRDSDEKDSVARSGGNRVATNPDAGRVGANGASSPVAVPGSPLPTGRVPQADLQAARDAVAGLVRCLDDRVKSLRTELRSGSETGSPRRESLLAAVGELDPLIAEAGERVAPVHFELQDARGMIPSVHEEVIEFARNFRNSAESLTPAGVQPDGTAVQVWLAQASMSVDGFLGGIVNPRYHHTPRSGIDFEMTQAALRRARNGELSSEVVPARTDRELPPRADAKPNPQAPPEGSGAGSLPAPRYTLGQLIAVLDGIEQHRGFRLLNHQEQLRRNPLGAMANRVYEAALAWRPDETTTPGITRIELLCDSLPGEPGITAAKVRRLRADVCRRLTWQIPQANELTLNDAADVLEGICRVSRVDLESAQQQQLYHGHATLDMIQVGVEPGQEVQVTGLSCKVVRGSTPTACPDANPVLPPSLLGVAEQAIRRICSLPPGTTIHWVGHDTGMRSRCRCPEHRDAPFAAPFHQDRWAAVATTSTPQTEVAVGVDANIPDPVRVIPPPIVTPVRQGGEQEEHAGRPGALAAGQPDEPKPRLVFDDPTRTIALDGSTDVEPLAPEVYQFLKAIGSGNRCGTMVPGRDITGPGLAGKKLRRIVDKLPARWKRLVTSQRGSGGGYCLTLPPRNCP